MKAALLKAVEDMSRPSLLIITLISSCIVCGLVRGWDTWHMWLTLVLLSIAGSGAWSLTKSLHAHVKQQL